MPTSDDNTKPRAIIVHSPAHNLALKSLSRGDVGQHNFHAVPEWSKLSHEFHNLVTAIKGHGIELIELADVLERPMLKGLDHNPNSMFTRDPVITLPWLPHAAIVSRMALPSRQSEPSILQQALKKLGFSHFFEAPQGINLEGGDVLAKWQNGKRVLYVGNGDRTNVEAVLWLAETLIKPGHLDEIICFKHNRAMLHLDTCFTILPNKTVLCARDTFREGFIVDKTLQIKSVDPLKYLKSQNYRLIFISQEQAERNEGCNLLYVGSNEYLSFNLPEILTIKIETFSAIKLHLVDGSEIAKANGGAHCLTLPLY